MSSGEKVRLGDVVTIEKAAAPQGESVWLLNLNAVEKNTGRVLEKVMVTPSEVGTSTVPFSSKAVLYSKLRPNLNKVVMPDDSGFATSEMLPLVADSNVLDRRYLAAFLRSRVFVNYAVASTAGAKMPRVNKKTVLDAKIRLPELHVQDERANTFSAIEAKIETAEQQIAQLDQLVKSRFVEMFGDLKNNEHNWPIEPFDSFATIDTHMTKSFEAYADKPHIGIDSIESDTGRLSGYRTVAEDGIISGKYPFTAKHIIYSKIRPALNKVALPNFDGVCSADAYPILPKEGQCDRVYLAQVMRSVYFLDYVLPLSGRAQMPKVNKKALQGFSMPLPPLALQQDFAAFVAQVDKTRAIAQQQIDKLQTLYDSLAQDYFA